MRRLLALAVFLAVSACGGDASTRSSTTLSGTYNLTTVNGRPLPFTYPGTNPISVLSEAYTFYDNNTFSLLISVRADPTRGLIVDQSGTGMGSYTRAGSLISISFTGSTAPIAGTLVGNTLTITDGTDIKVYTR